LDPEEVEEYLEIKGLNEGKAFLIFFKIDNNL
jgi:hypothetical protein